MFINVVNLAKSFSDQKLFENISFVINKGDKIVLIGPNGCGKTTLLDIIFGKVEADKGKILKENGLSVSYLPQKINNDYLVNCMDDLNQASLSNINVNKALFNEVASGLDIWDVLEKNSNELSGGQKVKIALAHTLVFSGDLLLLDEPTNYLDLKSISWLESFLKDKNLTFVTISHDRYFIDQIAKKIFYLGRDGLESYSGGYSDFEKAKEKKLEKRNSIYRSQISYKKKLEANMRKKAGYARAIELGTKDFVLRVKAKTLAKSVKAHQKRLQKQMDSTDWVGKPYAGSTVFVRMNPEIEKDGTIIRAKGISYCYSDGRDIVSGVDFAIRSSEKIAILGENGSGKTTLLRLIAGELKPKKGEIWQNPDFRIAYFSQDINDLNPDSKVLDAVRENIKTTEHDARSVLGGLLIGDKMLGQKILELSQGERTKVGFARKILENPDLLILDEFCAHLDIDAISNIQKAINKYQGAVVLVSHDRYMLQNLNIDRFYEIKNGKLKYLFNGLDEYI